MASPQYASTSETTNAGRASRVLLGPCSDQLRDLLRHHVSTSTFSKVIHQQKRTLSKLTKPQLDLIFPRSGPYIGNYSDFDISLLYTLLRNVCNIPKHNKGWGKDPDPNDMSLSANIERIRNSRNRLGHALDFALSDSDFIDILSSIRSAVVEIDNVLKNNQKYVKAVDFIKVDSMDSEMASWFKENLRKQIMEDTELKSLLSEYKNSLDQNFDDIRLNQDAMAKTIETLTKVVRNDQQRIGRNAEFEEDNLAMSNSVQPSNRFYTLLYWILTVFGIMRIINFFWKKEELMELEVTEISYSSVLLQWENAMNRRGNLEESYVIEYGITRSNHVEKKVAVKSCEHILDNLKHSSEYEVQVKILTSVGEKEHSKKIKFKTKALEKLQYTEISEASILLKWEPKKYTRVGNSTVFVVVYECTEPDSKVEKVEVKNCEYRLEKLKHSTEYRVHIKVKTQSGEHEHTEQITFKTMGYTARVSTTIALFVVAVIFIVAIIIYRQRSSAFRGYEEPIQAIAGDPYTEISQEDHLNPASNDCGHTMNDDQGSSYLDPLCYRPVSDENFEDISDDADDALTRPEVCVDIVSKNEGEDSVTIDNLTAKQSSSPTYSYVQMDPMVGSSSVQEINMSID